jgi:hypothetical protein
MLFSEMMHLAEGLFVNTLPMLKVENYLVYLVGTQQQQ